ncbi:recombinase family protein [Microbacterium sp. 77mftsu3.1]|uniref:recombinase family protein n=1 Tax=Microbacterium sp. 77mftsu3.1 TaxID=1761802 RepID=UPI00035DC85B|nr:recombinase family protein [Microbacterium sp. 77mftsu3.1]SDG23405.1 Site-specific DNA recombinase [Microbacterium sp. 77mftsu3.1]
MSPRPVARLNRRRAVLYLRQSTYREESISLELQEAAGRDYCARQGYDVIAVEADPGISGRTWQRPAVQRVMGMIDDGSADVVVLWRWSRLSRSRKDWALAADRADLAGGSIESATEPNDATAAGRFARGVMTELAAFESERIGEQWKETHDRRRRLGLPSDGADRFGYEKRDGWYHPHPVQAPLLAEMYRRYLRGEGFTRIVKWLNESGHTTRRGGTWSRVTLTHLLDAGFGAGKIIQRPTTKDRRDWRISEATFHPGAQTPVITPAEWDEYVALRLDAPKPATVVEPKYALTGLIVCGDCGAPMHVGNQGLKDYKCSRAAQVRDVSGMYMTRALVEQRVREWVEEIAADVDGEMERRAKQRERRVVQLDNAGTVDRKIADLTDRMGRITVRWSSGDLPDAAYTSSIALLDADLAALRERRRRAAPIPRIEINPQRVAADLAGDWEALTVIERRNLLRALIHQVRIVKPTRPGTGVWRERVQIIPSWAAPIG